MTGIQTFMTATATLGLLAPKGTVAVTPNPVYSNSPDSKGFSYSVPGGLQDPRITKLADEALVQAGSIKDRSPIPNPKGQGRGYRPISSTKAKKRYEREVRREERKSMRAMQEQSLTEEMETNKGKEKEPAQARKGEPINGGKQEKTPQQQDMPPRAKTEKSCFRPEITPEIEETLPNNTENFFVHVRGLSEGESADSVISMNDGQHWETPAPGFLRFPSDTLTGEEIKDIVSDMGIEKPADEECATRVDLLKGNLENPGYIAEEREFCGFGSHESDRTCHGRILKSCARAGADRVTCTGDVENNCGFQASHVTCEGDVANHCAYNSQDVTCEGDVGGTCSSGSQHVTCEGDVTKDCATGSSHVVCEGNVGGYCNPFGNEHIVCEEGDESMPKPSKNLLLDIDLCANGTPLNAQGAIPDSACIGNISDANSLDVFCDGPVFITKKKQNVTLLDVGCASDKGSNGSDEGKGSNGSDEGKGSNLLRDVGIGIGATLAGASLAAGAAGTGVACARSCEKDATEEGEQHPHVSEEGEQHPHVEGEGEQHPHVAEEANQTEKNPEVAPVVIEV